VPAEGLKILPIRLIGGERALALGLGGVMAGLLDVAGQRLGCTGDEE